MPIEQNHDWNEPTAEEALIQTFQRNMIHPLNDHIADMSKEEISSTINQALKEFSGQDLFIQ